MRPNFVVLKYHGKQSESSHLYLPYLELSSDFAEGEQLSSLLAGPSPAHHVPALLLGPVLARLQADAHRSEAGEHPLRLLRLGSLLQSQKGVEISIF